MAGSQIERTTPFPCLFHLSASWYLRTSLCISFPFCLFFFTLFLSLSLFVSLPISRRIAWTDARSCMSTTKTVPNAACYPKRNQPSRATSAFLRAYPSQLATRTRVRAIVNIAHSQTSLLFSFSLCHFLSLESSDVRRREKSAIH